MHEELERLAHMARSMIETDSPHMDAAVNANIDLYDEHIEAGDIIAERVEEFTRGLWEKHVENAPMPSSMASRASGATHDEAMAALGNLSSATTDVDAIHRLVVDVGVIASHVFMREGRRHYEVTEVGL